MKIKFLIYLSLFIFNVDAYSKSIDKSNCLENPKDTSEILKLFSVVKNSVLGTVPKFCREGEPDQLADDDIASKDLDKFVKKLKSSMKNVPDTTALDKDSDTRKDAVILNTLRLVVLKKFWINLSEESQLKVLISDQCGKYGLNRTILNKEYKSKNKDITSGQDKALETLYTACNVESYEELAPYLSKDVLAEGLFNLKRIFPQSFPTLLDNLCINLKKTDELIYKTDMYSTLAGAESKDVDKFSSWLKNLYAKIENKTTVQNIIEKSKAKLIIKNMVKSKITLDESDETVSGSQKNLKKYYDAAQVKGEAEKNPPHIDFPGTIVAKSVDGKYFLKIDSETKQKKIDLNLNYIKQYQAEENEIAKKYEQLLKIKMQEAYVEAEKQGIPPSPVPYPEYPGFFIGKKEDNSYYLYLDEKGKSNIKLLLKHSEKAFNDNYKQQGNNYKQPDSSAYQALYKNLYEAQKIYGEDYFHPALTSSHLGLGYDSGHLKIVLKDGVYSVDNIDVSDLVSKSKKKAYDQLLPLFQGDDIVAIPTPMSGLIIKKDKGDYIDTYMVDPIFLQILEPSNSINKDILPVTLLDTLKENYQASTANYEKIALLTNEENEAVSYYTGSGYASLNSCLRAESCDMSSQKIINNLISGIEKIKRKDKAQDEYLTLYRGSNLPKKLLQELEKEPKNFVLDRGFMSTSADINTSKNFGSNIFILKVKSCIGVASISNAPHEDEFLCPPGMKFNVKKQPGSNGNVFIVDEVK